MTTTVTKTTLRPTGDKILIRPDKAEEKSKGGIYIPGSARVKPAQGTVIAVGPGREVDFRDLLEQVTRTTETFSKMVTEGFFYIPGQIVPRTIPVALKAGQRVLYTRYAGSDVKHEDEDYLFIDEKNVLAVIEESDGV